MRFLYQSLLRWGKLINSIKEKNMALSTISGTTGITDATITSAKISRLYSRC